MPPLYCWKEDKTIERTISGMVGKGSITHNSRAFKAKKVKEDYTQYNIEYCMITLRSVKLFFQDSVIALINFNHHSCTQAEAVKKCPGKFKGNGVKLFVHDVYEFFM